MSMFNECLIHLCDCTCSNVLHILNYMSIKHKNIFEFFNFFWKVFLFWKFSKFWKTVQLYFGDSLANQGPSREKDLEKFQNFGFVTFSRLNLVTDSRVEAPVASFTQKVLRLPSQLSRRWTFQSQKSLGQIFQNLSHRILSI